MDWYEKSDDIAKIADDLDPLFRSWYIICTFDLSDGRNNEASDLLRDELPLHHAEKPWPENIYIGKVKIQKNEAENRVDAAEWVVNEIQTRFRFAKGPDGKPNPIQLSSKLFVAASEYPFAIAFPDGLH